MLRFIALLVYIAIYEVKLRYFIIPYLVLFHCPTYLQYLIFIFLILSLYPPFRKTVVYNDVRKLSRSLLVGVVSILSYFDHCFYAWGIMLYHRYRRPILNRWHEWFFGKMHIRLAVSMGIAFILTYWKFCNIIKGRRRRLYNKYPTLNNTRFLLRSMRFYYPFYMHLIWVCYTRFLVRCYVSFNILMCNWALFYYAGYVLYLYIYDQFCVAFRYVSNRFSAFLSNLITGKYRLKERLTVHNVLSSFLYAVAFLTHMFVLVFPMTYGVLLIEFIFDLMFPSYKRVQYLILILITYGHCKFRLKKFLKLFFEEISLNAKIGLGFVAFFTLTTLITMIDELYTFYKILH